MLMFHGIEIALEFPHIKPYDTNYQKSRNDLCNQIHFIHNFPSLNITIHIAMKQCFPLFFIYCIFCQILNICKIAFFQAIQLFPVQREAHSSCQLILSLFQFRQRQILVDIRKHPGDILVHIAADFLQKIDDVVTGDTTSCLCRVDVGNEFSDFQQFFHICFFCVIACCPHFFPSKNQCAAQRYADAQNQDLRH